MSEQPHDADILLQSVDEAGVTTTYTYDDAGRLTRAARDDGEAIDIGHVW